MMARLGEGPLASDRPSSEASCTPPLSSIDTLAEQRSHSGPARKAEAVASRARNGSRWLIKASLAGMMWWTLDDSQAPCRRWLSQYVEASADLIPQDARHFARRPMKPSYGQLRFASLAFGR